MAEKEKINKIEDHLKFKCIQELNNTVEVFIYEIEKLDKKYGGNTFFDLEWGDWARTQLREGEFKNILVDCLKERHFNYMVAYKSKELIKKIELLDD